MLKKKILIEAKTVVDDVEIAVHSAAISNEDYEVSFAVRQIDKEACKQHRDKVRSDRVEFEDYVYKLQDELKAGD